MSESAKRPGVRDISDLKARLGLKKAAPAKGRGVVPPPGVSVRPPPGAEPPRPRVSDDPFGALNAAAQPRAAVEPQIIVKIERDEHIESVERKNKMIGIAKLVGIVLIPLVVGIAVGQIGTNAKNYNRTIADAGTVAKEVKRVRLGLADFQKAFQKGETRGFSAYDDELTKALEGVKFVPPDGKIMYESFVYDLNPELVGNMLYFASEATKLVKDIEKHIEITKVDAKNLDAAIKNKKAGEPEKTENDERYSTYRYAVVPSIPTDEEAQKGKPFGARLVEIGRPKCADGNVSETGECAGPVAGFRVRTGPDDPWKTIDLAPGSAENDKIVPLLPNGTMDTLVKGSTPSLTEMTYAERVKSLSEKTKQVIELGESVQGRLDAKSREGEKFTFFL
ncbi:MAG TPA: hypothetical protein VML75_15200 [Kofleriaceae bacterium]|nr:hypothetical protein [Kofleriaceae bacterium]